MRVDAEVKWDFIANDPKVTLEDLVEIMHSGVDGNDIHQAISDWYDATYDKFPEEDRQKKDIGNE